MGALRRPDLPLLSQHCPLAGRSAEKRVPDVRDEIVKNAVQRAADILSGMGYTGPHGSIHLLDLNLQSNTITGILHNMIAWQISKLDSRWEFHPKGGRTADLTSKDGSEIQIKTTSDDRIKGNYVS